MASTAITLAAVNSDDFSSAVSLLGSITFIMAMMYLLLNPDEEVRRYSWSTLTAAISNFLGALIARSNGDNIALYVLGPVGASKGSTIAVWACICAGWFLLLQFVLMAIAREKKNYDRMILNLKCFGVLIALATGFSNLTLWGTFQQVHLSSFPWTAPIALLILTIIFRLSSKMRHFIANYDDDTEDVYEKAWFKYCKETEDAVLTLTLAHVTVQSIRYGITGYHPLPTGADTPDFKPKLKHAIYLELFAGMFLAIFFMCDVLIPSWLDRYKVWIKGSIGNACAFCAFYSMDWFTKAVTALRSNDEGLLLAVYATVSGFVLLLILHQLAILECMPEKFGKEVRAVVGPVSFMIGFAWKQATLSAIDVINERTPMPKTMNEVVLTLAIAVIVVPVWRWYILPVVIEMDNPIPKNLPEVAAEMAAAADNYEKLPAEPSDPEVALCQCASSRSK